MKSLKTSLAVLTCCWLSAASAQLELCTNQEPQQVFGGGIRKIQLQWHNPGSTNVTAEINTRLFQTTSATAVPLGEKPWQHLEILAGQTVMETAEVDLPTVTSQTKFIIQWLVASNKLVGKTIIQVYPTNMSDALKQLLPDTEKGTGILDPADALKPWFHQEGIHFVDLGETELESFTGKLAIIGPCRQTDPEWPGLSERVGKLASKGCPVIWVLPKNQKNIEITPNFYTVSTHHYPLLIVQPQMVEDLGSRPQSVLNLIHFCKTSLDPQPTKIPELSTKH